MASSVPLSAQLPISAPTAKRMKIAPMPLATLAEAASVSSAIVHPRRAAISTAIIAATVSATWFGPFAPASPKRKKESATSTISAATGTRASRGLGGRGAGSISLVIAPARSPRRRG